MAGIAETFESWEALAAAIQADRSASCWLQAAVRELIRKDPVDAAGDAELIAALMRWRADTVLGRDTGERRSVRALMGGE